MAMAFCKYSSELSMDPEIKHKYFELENLLSCIYNYNSDDSQFIEDILNYNDKLCLDMSNLMYNWRAVSFDKFMELLRVKEQSILVFNNNINIGKFVDTKNKIVQDGDIFNSPVFLTWSEFITGLATKSISPEARYLKFNAFNEFNEANKQNNMFAYQLLTKQMYNNESERMNNCIRTRYTRYCKWDSFAFALEVNNQPYNIEVSFNSNTKKYVMYEAKAKNNKSITDSNVNKAIKNIIDKCQLEFEKALDRSEVFRSVL
jgi:hypothetical protein